eukprot:886978-Pyramimonas_sp.AAC.3
MARLVPTHLNNGQTSTHASERWSSWYRHTPACIHPEQELIVQGGRPYTWWGCIIGTGGPVK